MLLQQCNRSSRSSRRQGRLSSSSSDSTDEDAPPAVAADTQAAAAAADQDVQRKPASGGAQLKPSLVAKTAEWASREYKQNRKQMGSIPHPDDLFSMWAARDEAAAAEVTPMAAADGAQQLLEAVLNVLSSTAELLLATDGAAAVPQQLLQQVLSVLRVHKKVPLQLQNLPSALCTAVQLAAASGDLRTHSTVQQEAAGLGKLLTKQDLAALQWAAVTGAAQAVAAGRVGAESNSKLLQLWPAAVACSSALVVVAGQQQQQRVFEGGVAAVVAAMAADLAAAGQLSQQLLVQPLPPIVLLQLLGSAVNATNKQQQHQPDEATDSAHVQVMQLLGSHAVQHGLLITRKGSTFLLPAVLGDLLGALLAPGMPADLSTVLPLLALLLQQPVPGAWGSTLQQPCVRQLLQQSTATSESWGQLLAWLTAGEGGTAHSMGGSGLGPCTGGLQQQRSGQRVLAAVPAGTAEASAGRRGICPVCC
jgi:hypothetical protein